MPPVKTGPDTKLLTTRPLDSLTLLNLGCGNDIHPTYINLDLRPFPGVDVEHDITKPLPFADNSFAEVHANHVLEHFIDMIPIMNEVFRVLQPGGIFKITVPWWTGTWARGDPYHLKFFDDTSFNPYSDQYQSYKFLGIDGPWERTSQTYQERDDFDSNPWLKRAGYSCIQQMTVYLRKPPQ